MTRGVFKSALLAIAIVLGTPGLAQAKTTLKMATLAPSRSPWGKVFRTWSKAVTQKTNGEVVIDWLWNGAGGEEHGVVGKIKSGNLAGGAITSIGMAAIDRRFIALESHGVFKSWAELDAAREKLVKDIVSDQAVKSKFYIPGFGDVGIGHLMSRGFLPKVPADLRGHHLAMEPEDVITAKILEAIGGVSGVSTPVTEFLPKLNAGAIDAIDAPALAAEQLQWVPHLDNINTASTYFAVGAVVMSEKALERLSSDQRETVRATGVQAAQALTARIRKADAESYERLKKKLTVHESTAAENQEWKAVYDKACEKLKATLPGGAMTTIGAC